jgi:uncharacterized protein YPO0396
MLHSGWGLKSTEEKQERIQKTQAQVDFFEGKKADLKNMHCDTLEEIGKKLELFNNYNDQIDAVKRQFNYEQMRQRSLERKSQRQPRSSSQRQPRKEEKSLQKKHSASRTTAVCSMNCLRILRRCRKRYWRRPLRRC